jgi:pimeloyl-ACP methyl ester carboxylesterase
MAERISQPRSELNLPKMHFWGDESFFDPNISQRKLIITGTPEGAGLVAGTERLDDCLNSDIPFGQIYTGSYTETIDKSADHIKMIFDTLHIGTSDKKIDLMAYSFGAQALAEFVKNNPQYHQNINSITLISPSIGGKSIPDNLTLMRFFYPNDQKYLQKVTPLFNQLASEGKLTLITATQDEYVNSNFVNNIFQQNFPKTKILSREGTHAITAADVNSAFDLLKPPSML